MSAEARQFDHFDWGLATQAITVRIRWFGICIGYVLVNLIGEGHNLAVQTGDSAGRAVAPGNDGGEVTGVRVGVDIGKSDQGDRAAAQGHVGGRRQGGGNRIPQRGVRD